MGTTGKPESATVQSPLHLLQVLTRTLNEHLSEACTQAQTDAQEALDKLDREQQKLTEKVEQARSQSSDGQPDQLGELTQQLDAVNQARTDAEGYVRQLQSDVRQTLRLAKGLERIELQATQAIDKRNNPEAAAPTKRPATRRSRGRKPAAANGTAPQNPPAAETKD